MDQPLLRFIDGDAEANSSKTNTFGKKTPFKPGDRLVLTAGKGDPAGVLGGFPAPVRRHQESAGDGERNDAHDDEEQRGDPLRRQPWRDACPIPSVDGLTLPHQAHRERTCRGGERSRAGQGDVDAVILNQRRARVGQEEYKRVWQRR